MVVGSPVRRATECYTRWWYNGRSRGFLQYRWKWPRDKFLQLLSNRRANRPREYCESSVCTRSCGRLASPQPVLLLRTKNPPPSPRVHLVRPFIPSTSFRRLTFFSQASYANAYPRRDRSPDGSKNCMPLPKKPACKNLFSRSWSTCTLPHLDNRWIRASRVGYGDVLRIFRCYLPLVRLLFDAWRSRIEFRVVRLILHLFL